MRRTLAAGILVALTVQLWGAPADQTLNKLLDRIPKAPAAKANVDAEYNFTVDYINADAHGAPATTQRIVGEYRMNPATGATTWLTVTTGTAPGFPKEIAATEHQAYMEGMHYDRSANPLAEGFFAKFPAQAVQVKNLVWDTWMFDGFVHGDLDKLRLNLSVPFTSGTVSLAGAGSFHNQDVRLTWTGISRRNGRDCALIRYEAFLNTFTISVPGFKVVGRSEYWGDMWVALDTHALEYATLREEVVGTVTSEQAGTVPMHVLRVGTVERTK